MAIYAQIAAELRHDIHHGVFQIGDRLPTEAQLAERFDVNRHTIRQAIALLRYEGLVRVEQGRGTFVSSRFIRYAIGKRVRYSESLKAQGKSAVFKVLRAMELPASAAVAESLQIPVGQSVALIERLSIANHEPISISTGYFPVARCPGILEPEAVERLKMLGSISQFLRQVFDYDHIRWQTTVSARLVKPQDARLLELPLNQPILLAESLNVNQHGVLIEYGMTRFRGDRMEMVFENDVSDLLQSPDKPS